MLLGNYGLKEDQLFKDQFSTEKEYNTMKHLSVLILIFFLGCDTFKGPTGPAGIDGEDGKDMNITILSGTLTSGGLIDAGGWFTTDYWLINTYKSLDNAIVDVRVRSGSGYKWRGCSWNLYGTSIYIYDTIDASPGYEYRILISK